MWQEEEWPLLKFPEHSVSQEQEIEIEEHAMNSAATQALLLLEWRG